MSYSTDFERLKQWFLREGRDLPWRTNPSPYGVWVSEIMLQQTQVSTVIPYFERWMKRYPTVQDLSCASLDEVIKLWEGLGYYSRARNLLEGARYVLEYHGGNIPRNEAELAKIKGLGPYTIGAIRSFAFHQKAAAVDGNVLRVFARYKMLKKDIRQGSTLKEIRQDVQAFLPDKEPWIVNEALIELGATLCRKVPACSTCPLRQSCKSHINGVAAKLPIRTPPPKTQSLYRAVAVVCCEDLLLVKRGKSGAIMQDLYEFPYLEIAQSKGLLKTFTNRLSLPLKLLKELKPVNHSYTRYRAHLKPLCFETRKPRAVEGYQWLSFEILDKLAFSAGHRKIYRMIRS